MLRRAFLAAIPLAAQPSPIRIEPAAPFPGSPILFSLNDRPANQATWLERTLPFEQDEKSKRWLALAAVGLDTRPGAHVIDLGDGHMHLVRVSPHLYRTGRLTVPPQFVQPPAVVAKRIEQEQAAKKKAFAERSKRFWKGAFAPPTDTSQSSPFGTRRTYNGKTRSVHQGLDFRAGVGTPVRASNTGKVLIASEMYFEGGFVVLDHGEGLFTLYMHLSAFGLKVGDLAEKGQQIAESGNSGRVTGPHLHFGVQWQGLYMEPATLLGMLKV